MSALNFLLQKDSKINRCLCDFIYFKLYICKNKIENENQECVKETNKNEQKAEKVCLKELLFLLSFI